MLILALGKSKSTSMIAASAGCPARGSLGSSSNRREHNEVNRRDSIGNSGRAPHPYMVVYTLSLAVELCEGGDLVIVSVSISIFRAVRRRRGAGILQICQS